MSAIKNALLRLREKLRPRDCRALLGALIKDIAVSAAGLIVFLAVGVIILSVIKHIVMEM